MLLKILNVVKQTNYVEVNYEMTLDVPTAQQEARGGVTTVKTAVSSYPNGTGVAAIKNSLVIKLNAAQTALNNDTTYQYYGITYNGSTWSA